MALFDTKYANTSRIVTGTPQLYNDDVILLCDTSTGPVRITLLDIPAGKWSTQWKLYVFDISNNASVNNITILANGAQLINTQSSVVLNTNGAGAMVRIVADDNFLGSLLYQPTGGGGGVSSVTGLNTDNTDPTNPIVQISVDGVTITGSGTLADPLVSVGTANRVIEFNGVAQVDRNIVDYVGNFVFVSDTGGDTTSIRIDPTIIDILYADLVTKIGASGLIKGLSYRITDPTVDSYIDNGVILMAVDVDKIELEGTGLYLNADYQAIGDYSEVNPAFVSQLGRWNDLLAPAIGDVCIYNNIHYVNITGANSTSTPQGDSTNWTALAKNLTNGYIAETCAVTYNLAQNRVVERRDTRQNLVQYSSQKGLISYQFFPFGDDVVYDNEYTGFQTITENLCNVPFGVFSGNRVQGFIDITTNNNPIMLPNYNSLTCNNNIVKAGGKLSLTGYNHGGVISQNEVRGNLECNGVDQNFGGRVIMQRNTIQGFLRTINVVGANDITIVGNSLFADASRLWIGIVNTNNAPQGVEISANAMNVDSKFQIESITSGIFPVLCNFSNNTITREGDFNIVSLTDNALQGGQNSILTPNESTFKEVLDLSDPAVYNPATSTLILPTLISPFTSYVGEWLITGSGETISVVTEQISGGGVYPFSLVANNSTQSLAFRLSTSLIASSVEGEIIENSGHTAQLLFDTYPAQNYGDYVTLKRLKDVGGYNFIQEIHKAV